MTIIKKITAAYLLLHAAAAALFTIIEPLYHNIETQGYSQIWRYLDPMTAAGILLGIIFAAAAKRPTQRPHQEPPLLPRLAADAKLYGFLFLALLFYRNFFNDLTGSSPHPQAADVQWAIIYALYPLLAAAQALTLCRRQPPESPTPKN